MKKIIYLATAAALTLFGCAEEVSEDESKATGSIYGIILDKATTEPVRGAGVQLNPVGTTAVTGDEGQYEFTELKAGDYTINVTKTGYADLVSYKISVAGGKTNKGDVQIEKLPAALKIINTKGEPIDTLDFGESSIQLSFSIFNNTPDNLEWAITKDREWITEITKINGAIPATGTKQQPVSVTIGRTQLTGGANTGNLNITSNNGSAVLVIKAFSPVTSLPTLNTLQPVEDIGINSATFKGQITAQGMPEYDECGFVYTTNSNTDPKIEIIDNATVWRVTASINRNDAVFSAPAINLTLGQTYYVVAYAHSSLGYAYGNKMPFTVSNMALPTLNTFDVNSVASNSATFNGTILSPGIPAYTERGFVYSTSSMPTYETSITPRPTAAVNSTADYSAQVSGLTLGQTYYVRAYAKNSVGYAYSTNEFPFSTATSQPSVSVQDATEVSVNTAILHGTVISQGDPAYTERGFCYATTRNPTIYNQHTAADGNGVTGEFSKAIDDLLENKTYYVRSYVRVNNNAPAYSTEEKSFTTPPATPPTLETMDAANIGTTTVTLRGYINNIGNPPYTERGFCYGTAQNPAIYSQTAVATGRGIAGEFSKSVTNLIDNETYYVRAYARTNDNEPQYGAQKQFTTQHNSSTANAAISDHVAISNGIGFWFNPSIDTRHYY
ncbi:MAG: carboxypeptidase-like regulatory domain-containing protein [Prevotellaceae bacterium]|jgi:hypothetical protein|nr:carboxypeptidase-like regulatory domain-containing protein [Prevotellaceae bacterium]